MNALDNAAVAYAAAINLVSRIESGSRSVGVRSGALRGHDLIIARTAAAVARRELREAAIGHAVGILSNADAGAR